MPIETANSNVRATSLIVASSVTCRREGHFWAEIVKNVACQPRWTPPEQLPNFGGPLNRIAGSLENIAGNVTGQDAAETPDETVTGHAPDEGTAEARTRPELTLVSPNESSAPSGEHKEPIHA